MSLKVLMLLSLAVGLTSTFATSARAVDAAPGDLKLELQPLADVKPADHKTNEQIEKDFEDYASTYKKYANLFTADDFRTPIEKKFLARIKWDAPDTLIKIQRLEKELDKMQNLYRHLFLLTAGHVSEKQQPRVYNLAKKAAKALEMRGKFNIFIVDSPDYNAFTYSYNQSDFDVVINSALADQFSDEALLAVLGHEMGHVKEQAMLVVEIMLSAYESKNTDTPASKHMEVYERMFPELPVNIRNSLADIALAAVANDAVIKVEPANVVNAAIYTIRELFQLSRECESTADRAGVLVSGNAKGLAQSFAGFAWGAKAMAPDFNFEAYMEQLSDAVSMQSDAQDLDRLINAQGSHPYSAIRALQAHDYEKSKSFASIRQVTSQSAFSRELDMFTRMATQALAIATKQKKYEETAEYDDTFLRLKTEKAFKEEAKGYLNAMSVLRQLVLTQLEASDLALADNTLFLQLQTKVKADKAGSLKGLIVDPLIELMKKNQSAATADSDEAKELSNKLKTLQDIKESA